MISVWLESSKIFINIKLNLNEVLCPNNGGRGEEEVKTK